MMEFESVLRYKAAMLIFRQWYADAIISTDELLQLDTMMGERCGLPFNSIYRTNNLICTPERANMDAEPIKAV